MPSPYHVLSACRSNGSVVRDNNRWPGACRVVTRFQRAAVWRAQRTLVLRDLLKLGRNYTSGTAHGAAPNSYRPPTSGNRWTVQNRGEFLWREGTLRFPCVDHQHRRLHEAFYARGYGGQYLMAIPRADLVRPVHIRLEAAGVSRHFALVEEFIVPAIAPISVHAKTKERTPG